MIGLDINIWIGPQAVIPTYIQQRLPYTCLSVPMALAPSFVLALLIPLSMTFDVPSIVDNWTTCPKGESVFLKISKISFRACVTECYSREMCAGVGYRRRFLLCELYSKATLSLDTLKASDVCIFVRRSDGIPPVEVSTFFCSNLDYTHEVHTDTNTHWYVKPWLYAWSSYRYEHALICQAIR